MQIFREQGGWKITLIYCIFFRPVFASEKIQQFKINNEKDAEFISNIWNKKISIEQTE